MTNSEAKVRIAGLAKAPCTSTGRMVWVISNMAAPASAATSARSRPWTIAETTPTSTSSAMICSRVIPHSPRTQLFVHGEQRYGTRNAQSLCFGMDKNKARPRDRKVLYIAPLIIGGAVAALIGAILLREI